MSDETKVRSKRGPSIPGGGKRKNRDVRKEQRAADAEIRNEERANRTPAEQLARLDEGGFVATKERKRLGGK